MKLNRHIQIKEIESSLPDPADLSYREAKKQRDREAVRRARKYVYDPVLFDRFAPHLAGLKKGDLVIKTQPSNCPRNGTMGMCYIADLESQFIGMVCLGSLTELGLAVFQQLVNVHEAVSHAKGEPHKECGPCESLRAPTEKCRAWVMTQPVGIELGNIPLTKAAKRDDHAFERTVAEIDRTYYTTSQNRIPDTVQEAEAMGARRFTDRAEALADISQTGVHNVLLKTNGDKLEIDVALWDSL